MTDLTMVVAAVVLVVLAGFLTAIDAALARFSPARAQELAAEGRAGAKSVSLLLEDRPRYVNTALLLRMLCEVSAIVLVTVLLIGRFSDSRTLATGLSVAIMVIVSFVVIGVGPRTLGRQHAETTALWSAAPLRLVTRVLGPLPKLLILLGNALTPGRGFRDGPFASETELRELVDYAEESSLIESGERKMIHSVFELGDTTAREVMVPRPDVVFIERHKNLRQARSLFLRSGFSRIPVVGENLDEIVGFAYLKDVARRDFEDEDAEKVERIDTVMRPAHFVPESKACDALLSELQARRQHIAVVVDEYGGTAGIVTIEDILEEIVGEITDEYDDEIEVEPLGGGPVRVSSRYPIDDLEDIFPELLADVDLDDEDVDSVGGLMAKHLGVVPIPGSTVDVFGLHFEAEKPTGRRNRISTVLIHPLAEPNDSEAEPKTAKVESGDSPAST